MNKGTHTFTAIVLPGATRARFTINRAALTSSSLRMDWTVQAETPAGLVDLGGAGVQFTADAPAFAEANSGLPISGSTREIPPGATAMRASLNLSEDANVTATLVCV